jgi:hypothetical protein
LHNPGDEMVHESAVGGWAEAMVSYNRRDYGDVPGEFGIDILTPAEALRRLAP